jgi:hypothetical protein
MLYNLVYILVWGYNSIKLIFVTKKGGVGSMGAYKGSSAAQRRAVASYKRSKVDIITVQVPKGKKGYYKAAAALCGQSCCARKRDDSC